MAVLDDARAGCQARQHRLGAGGVDDDVGGAEQAIEVGRVEGCRDDAGDVRREAAARPPS